jgi:hypothetical protein
VERLPRVFGHSAGQLVKEHKIKLDNKELFFYNQEEF